MIDKSSLPKGQISIQYESMPPWRRPAVLPVAIILGISWLFTVALLWMSIGGMVGSYVGPTVLLTVVSIILLVYLVNFTRRFMVDFARHYVFEISDLGLRLKAFDALTQEEFIADMPIRDVAFVEYFTPRDSATFIFHGSTGEIIEVPIWSLTDDPKPILDLLGRERVNVLVT